MNPNTPFFVTENRASQATKNWNFSYLNLLKHLSVHGEYYSFSY